MGISHHGFYWETDIARDLETVAKHLGKGRIFVFNYTTNHENWYFSEAPTKINGGCVPFGLGWLASKPQGFT